MRPMAAAANRAVPVPSMANPPRIQLRRCSVAAVSSQTTSTLSSACRSPKRLAVLAGSDLIVAILCAGCGALAAEGAMA
jgi:hypothetical protein